MGKALFVHLFRSLLITYFITLSLEKEIIVLEKVWKSLEFWIKNLYEPCLEKAYFVVQMTGLVMSRCINA